MHHWSSCAVSLHIEPAASFVAYPVKLKLHIPGLSSRLPSVSVQASGCLFFVLHSVHKQTHFYMPC